MIDGIIAWATRQPRGVFFGVAALVAAGGWATTTLKVDAFPDLTDLQVQVLVESPGLSPLEVERLVAFPIEIAMNGMPRVTQIRSISKYAFAAITIVFEDDVGLQLARTMVAERLQGTREQLPPGTEA